MILHKIAFIITVVVFCFCNNTQGADYISSLQKDCDDNNNRLSCGLIAQLYDEDNNHLFFKEIPEKTRNSIAKEYYEKACNLDDAMSCYQFAAKLMFNHFADQTDTDYIQPNQEQINKLFVKACNLNFAPACSAAAATVFHQEKEIEYLTKGCNLKDGSLCYSLANIYQKAIKQNKEYIEYMDSTKKFAVPSKEDVANLYRKACSYNDRDSCYKLGLLYETGFGVNKDSNKADDFIIKACELEDSTACSAIGYRTFVRYQLTNDKNDYFEAVNHFTKACDLYNIKGCKLAAELYTLTEEFKQAVMMYQKACFLDDGESCYKVGSQLMTGTGCPLDKSLANKYFVISCINDYDQACKLIDPDDKFEYYEYARIIREAPWF